MGSFLQNTTTNTLLHSFGVVHSLLNSLLKSFRVVNNYNSKHSPKHVSIWNTKGSQNERLKTLKIYSSNDGLNNELGFVVLSKYWSNTGQIILQSSDKTGDPFLSQQNLIRKFLKCRHIFRNILVTFKTFLSR